MRPPQAAFSCLIKNGAGTIHADKFAPNWAHAYLSKAFARQQIRARATKGAARQDAVISLKSPARVNIDTSRTSPVAMNPDYTGADRNKLIAKLRRDLKRLERLRDHSGNADQDDEGEAATRALLRELEGDEP